MSNALIDNLEKYGAGGACVEAQVWMKNRTPAQIWLECENPFWLFWWISKNAGKHGWPTHQELVRVTVDYVRPVVDLHYPDPKHLCQIALTTALAWTRGEATVEECKIAAAYAAAYAADAPCAAANAAEHKRMCDIIRTAWPMPDALGGHNGTT